MVFSLPWGVSSLKLTISTFSGQDHTAYDKAITLNPDLGPAYEGKGNALDAFAPFAYEKYKQLAAQSYLKAQMLEQAKKKKGGQ
jgi:hypothetical protein